MQSRSFRNLYNFFYYATLRRAPCHTVGVFQIRTMKLVVVYCTVFVSHDFFATLFFGVFWRKTVHLLFFFVKWAWQPCSLGHTHILFSLLFAVYVIIWATFQRTDQINCITLKKNKWNWVIFGFAQNISKSLIRWWEPFFSPFFKNMQLP